MSRRLERLITQPCKVLILGVHGAAMRSIAQFCADLGHYVTGYDKQKRPSLIDKRIGLLSEKKDCTFDFVIYSTAFDKNSSLLLEYQMGGSELINRVQFISFLSQYYKTIAITGTQGKTTCSALLQHVMDQLGVEHDFIIGGFSKNAQCQGRSKKIGLKRSEYLLIELDESLPFDKTMQLELTCILNIKSDHLEHFNNDLKLYQHNFRALVGLSKTIVYDQSLCEHKLDFGLSAIQAQRLDWCTSSKELPFCASSKGVLFSMEVIVTALYQLFKVNINPIVFLKSFSGVGYRFEKLFQNESSTVYRDYGHLPCEIKNFYQSLELHYVNHKKIIIFQAHKYSRLSQKFDEFIRSLSKYDRVYLLPVYPAGENQGSYKTHTDLNTALNLHDDKSILIKNAELDSLIQDMRDEMCVLVFQGAGDVKDLAEDLLKNIKIGRMSEALS